jgi:hypothetical protein
MIVISERAQSNHNQTTTRISGKKKGAFFQDSQNVCEAK